MVKRIFFVFQVSDSMPEHLPAGDVNHLPVIAVPALRNLCLLMGIIVSLAWFWRLILDSRMSSLRKMTPSLESLISHKHHRLLIYALICVAIYL
jgi:hypothetical protein